MVKSFGSSCGEAQIERMVEQVREFIQRQIVVLFIEKRRKKDTFNRTSHVQDLTTQTAKEKTQAHFQPSEYAYVF